MGVETLFSLSAFRFFYCTYIAISYAVLFPYVRLASANSSVVVGPALAPYTSQEFFGFYYFEWFTFATMIAMCVAGAGIGRKASLWIATILYICLEYPLSMANQPYITNNVFFVMMILAVSPSTDAYNLRELAHGPDPRKESEDRWTQPLLLSILPLVYLVTGVAKVTIGGWPWLNGTAVQSILFERYLYTGSEWALSIAQSWRTCLVINILTISGEILFVAIMPFRSLRQVCALVAFIFHVMVYFILRINFIPLFCGVFLAFINYHYVYNLVTRFRWRKLCF